MPSGALIPGHTELNRFIKIYFLAKILQLYTVTKLITFGYKYPSLATVPQYHYRKRLPLSKPYAVSDTDKANN